MGSLRSGDLLALPVRIGGIELGRVVELVVDLRARRLLGLEVRCGDGTHRFLPLAAATIGDGEVAVPSALTLLDELAFYRARGSTLGSLRGGEVTSAAGSLGGLRDVAFDPAGAIRELVVGERRVPLGADVRVAARSAAFRPIG